ncbi:MAG TPA: hypothetical protein VJ464_26335 [Blastocatellia bacterium]|nr:hypothetical protein [Blastocatellia bacterium]
MDPNNPVVKLCVAGVQAETEGNLNQARALFTQAWAASRDDFEACIAAHYLARHQESPAEILQWNQEALKRADADGGERVREFYPSLYLNLGHSHEVLGNREEARKYYDMAAEKVDGLATGRYGAGVREAIAKGRERVELKEE